MECSVVLGQDEKARILRTAVVDAVATQAIRTPDIGGTNSTQDVVGAVIASVVAQLRD